MTPEEQAQLQALFAQFNAPQAQQPTFVVPPPATQPAPAMVEAPAPVPVAPVSVAPAAAPVEPSGDSPLKRALAEIASSDLIEAEEVGKEAARADMMQEANQIASPEYAKPMDYSALMANLDKASY